MDTLDRLLDATRARDAFALRAIMRAPWSLRIAAKSPLTLIVGISGEIWISPDNANPIRINPGDITLTRTPCQYNVGDSVNTPVQWVVHPGQECKDLEGNPAPATMMLDVRTWGNHSQGTTVLLVGAYEHQSDISNRLLRALPPILTLPQADWQSPLVSMLFEQINKDEPGQAAVLDRLLDLLVTAVLRAWFAKQKADNASAWQFQEDRIVEKALHLMQNKPSFAWTVDSLAKESGTSRASLSRRFNLIVGEPPMSFLKNWRMAIAADLLCQPNQSVATVADKVGYSTPFAFSSAFKRIRGVSPQQHRDKAMKLSR